MKATCLGFVLGISLFFLFQENFPVQGASTPQLPTPGLQNDASFGGEELDNGSGNHNHQGDHNRVSRAQPTNTMDEKLKDFAAKLGKTPDEVKAAFGKFMMAQGISLQQMQEEIEQAHQGALQILASIKKAMHV